MGTSPDLELQGLIINVLKADPDVIALVGDRVYDTVPDEPVFPYIAYAGSTELEDDADCIFGSDLFPQIDVWSRAVGFPECKRICNAVRNALHDADLQLVENALVMILCPQIRVLRDPDGLTNHGIVEVEAFVER